MPCHMCSSSKQYTREGMGWSWDILHIVSNFSPSSLFVIDTHTSLAQGSRGGVIGLIAHTAWLLFHSISIARSLKRPQPPVCVLG